MNKLLSEAINKSDIIDIYILMSMPEPHDEANIFIKNEKVKAISNTIIDEIDNILLRELRHLSIDYRDYGPDDDYKQYDSNIFESKYGISPKKINEIVKFLTKMFGREGKQKYFSTEITLPEINDIFQTKLSYQNLANIFSGAGLWESGYGGKNWSRIAIFAGELHNLLKDTTKFLTKLDRFVDFVHNNGAVINKFKGYVEGWLPFILDIKQNAVNIREIIPYASRDIQKMFRDQAWRMLMRDIPGKGADTSFEAYKPLIKKYINNAINVKEATPAAYNISNIANVVKKIGYDETVKLIRQNASKKELKKLLHSIGTYSFDKYSFGENQKKLNNMFNIGINAIEAAFNTHTDDQTFFEHYLVKSDPDLIKESPDVTETPDGYAMSYDADNNFTFAIVYNTVFWGDKEAGYTHSLLFDDILYFFKNASEKNDYNGLAQKLKDNDIYTINLPNNKEEIEKLRRKIRGYIIARLADDFDDHGVVENFISGRFFALDKGYVTFWEPYNEIVKHKDLLIKMIRQMGFDPMQAHYELYLQDDPAYTEGDEKQVPFAEYFNTQNAISDKEERAARQKQLALHLVPGMKKQTGNSTPGKQLNPNMTNAEYNALTKVGESFKTYAKKNLKLKCK